MLPLMLAISLIAIDTPVIREVRTDDRLHIYAVQSPYQAGETQIKVLLPDEIAPNERLPVVYLLPVEAQSDHKYGDGMQEAQRIDLANKHRVICVEPTFSQLPWYADHPSDPEIRQESHLLKVVVPLVDRTYPTRAEAAGRLLAGFSKSGWGAWTLLLRHPDIFGKAAAWDAPLMMDGPGKYGSGPIFGTAENFESYRITVLLRKRGTDLGPNPRLILTGYGGFREQHQEAHRLLTDLDVPHIDRDGPSRKHDWHSGWLGKAVELLTTPEREPNRR